MYDATFLPDEELRPFVSPTAFSPRQGRVDRWCGRLSVEPSNSSTFVLAALPLHANQEKKRETLFLVLPCVPANLTGHSHSRKDPD